MKLPSPNDLLVERDKILGYLLNPDHRFGASKAKFFGAFGFRRDTWEAFRTALCEHGRQHDVARATETGFGPRFEVQGELSAPDGRRPVICTVWQLDKGQRAPRLITAYPLERT